MRCRISMIAKNFMPHPNECRIDPCLGWGGKQNLDLPAGSHVLYTQVAKSGGAVTLWDSGAHAGSYFAAVWATVEAYLPLISITGICA